MSEQKKKIYYCIVEEVEVDSNLTDEQIDSIILEKADGKDCMWSEKENLLGEDY